MTGIAWKERGSGPAVVFLHGIGGGAESWDAQLAEIGRTHRALAWDMPGYGASVEPEEHGFDAWVGALAGWLDEAGVTRCTLVGHSVGGMIAQLFASRFPHRLDALVLSATSAAFGNPSGDFQKEFLRTRLGALEGGRPMAELAAEFVPDLAGPETPDVALRTAIAVMARVRPETYRDVLTTLVTFDARPLLPGIHVPALLIAGEADTAAPPKAMRRLADGLPDARLVCVPGMGHMGHMEMPQDYCAALRTIL